MLEEKDKRLTSLFRWGGSSEKIEYLSMSVKKLRYVL